MANEPGSARETKILSDILALALDEQPGVSTAALARIKARARADGVTGGALKEAFVRLQRPGGLGPEAAADLGGGTEGALNRARLQLAELRSQVGYAELLLRQERVRHAVLLRQARALSTVAGALAGAALGVLAMLALL